MKKKFVFPSWAKYVAIPVILFAIYKFYNLLKAAKNTGAEIVNGIKNDATTSVINNAISNAGLSPIRTTVCVDVANAIYEAFWQYYGGMFEDEVTAMDNFKMLNTTAEAKACAEIYKASYKKSLWTDIDKYCHNTNFDGVKQSHLNAIKGI